MIAFLAITSIINIALGYALAVYLGRASASLSFEPPLDPATEAAMTQNPLLALQQGAAVWPPSALAAATPTAPGYHSAETTPRETTAARFAEEPASQPGQSPPPAAEVEQGLLAGIEEFRNQLAQLKGPNFDEPIPGLMPTEAGTP